MVDNPYRIIAVIKQTFLVAGVTSFVNISDGTIGLPCLNVEITLVIIAYSKKSFGDAGGFSKPFGMENFFAIVSGFIEFQRSIAGVKNPVGNFKFEILTRLKHVLCLGNRCCR